MSNKSSPIERARYPVFLFTVGSFAVAGLGILLKLLTESNGYFKYTGYLLSLLQCTLGIFATLIPRILQKRYGFSFSAPLQITYFVFLYCAIFLGEVRNYYITVPIWDDILHGFSGIMAGIFAFMLIAVTTEEHSEHRTLSPLLIALFAFVFSVAIGALWEIYEFAIDGLFELNMQKYRQNDGTPLIGRNALFDTMKDIVIDSVGALIAAAWGYFSMINKENWISKYRKKRKVQKAR